MSKPITIAYKVICTNLEIKIDPEELQAVFEGIQGGDVVILKRGVFNPSYFIGIVEDHYRIDDFLRDTKYDTNKRLEGMKPLKDIFEDQNLLGDGK